MPSRCVHRLVHRVLIFLPVLVGLLCMTAPAAAAGPTSRVAINGETVPVSFNDGDSFRILGGALKGVQARLAGYNTLESYGPVHQWGTWTAKELYVIAKMATLHARRGVWHCTSDGKLDTYGRALLWCPDLATDLVRRGYAHALSVDDAPSSPELLAAQQEAQRDRRGIWAHGIPLFVLTSLHSVEEDTNGKGTSNRLVSSADGHSEMWKHENRYQECQTVCHKVYEISDAAIDNVAAKITTDPDFAPILGELTPEQIREAVEHYGRFRVASRVIPVAKRDRFVTLVALRVKNGEFGTQEGKPGACMIHIPFQRRYGAGRAQCLH